MKKIKKFQAGNGLVVKKKSLAVHVSVALMAAPFTANAAPPEPPPVQLQPDQAQGAASRQGAGAPLLKPGTLAEVRKLLEFPFELEEFPGIAAGSFLLFPQVIVSETYDDNIYAEGGDFTNRRYVVGDAVTTISPSLRGRSAWDKHSLSFEIGADVDRYASHSSEDVEDYYAGVEGRYDLSKTANVFGGVRYSRDHEDRGSADALSPIVSAEPTVYDEIQIHFGTAFKLGEKVAVRAGGAYATLDFKDVKSGTGTAIDMDFRDRKLDSLGARVSYELSPLYSVFAQYATDNRRYDQATTGRDSDGYRAAVGWGFNVDKKLQGEVFVGQLNQDFANAAYADVNKPYYGATLAWQKDAYTRVSAYVDRSLEESTLVGASSYLDTTLGGRVEHRISANTTVTGRAAYTHSDYQGLDRVDKIIDAGVGLRHYVTPSVYLGADYRMLTRDSNALIANYARNQVFFSVGYTPARARDYSIIPEAGAPAAPGARGVYSGFYLGAQLGHGGLTTETYGPRGGGGDDEGDMGKFGRTYALFAGWGTEINNWYLGVELDGGDSNARWYHSKNKDDSRTMSVDKNASYGMSARAGYLLEGGLLYGKLGLVRTDFHSYYTENQYAPGGAFDKSQTKTATRWGVGVEIPASPNFFVRMDYSYMRYPGYDVPYQSSGGGAITTEEFDTKENLFSVGLGWRFGGERPVLAKRSPTELRGFYLGGNVGHGAVNTKLTGQQMDSNPAPPPNYLGPYDFYGDFANTGATGGFFAGYGFTFSQIYLGVEVEAEAANLGWYHERTVAGGGGRDFAVEKRGSYGGSLRIGYVLDNGALLYGRIGDVRTQFNTTYNKGNGTNFWVDRLDRLNGTRVGFGAEVPAARNAFVRMDYSYTKYDSYGFVTGHAAGANPDAMTFQNNENLFRLGLGLRF